MKPFARINLSSVALRRGIRVSSLAREGRGMCNYPVSNILYLMKSYLTRSEARRKK